MTSVDGWESVVEARYQEEYSDSGHCNDGLIIHLRVPKGNASEKIGGHMKARACEQEIKRLVGNRQKGIVVVVRMSWEVEVSRLIMIKEWWGHDDALVARENQGRWERGERNGKRWNTIDGEEENGKVRTGEGQRSVAGNKVVEMGRDTKIVYGQYGPQLRKKGG